MSETNPASSNWVKTRISTACKSKPVDEAIATIIEHEIESSMLDRSLRPNELANLAKTLIELSTSSHPSVETDED
jgi:hypothetical protein